MTGILRRVTAQLPGWVAGLLLGTVALTPLMAADGPNLPFFADWPMFGQNAANTASAVADGIPNGNVENLKVKWTFTTGGDVSARAAVVGGVAYFPDWWEHLGGGC